ncbi:MAG: hypothetical protein ACYTGC_16055 [Planctomycetota bacterium]|jgi:hypothetical protein
MSDTDARRSFGDLLLRRPRYPRSPVLVSMLVMLLYVTIYLAITYVAGGDVPQRHFREGRAVDTMSTVFLAMASACAWGCFLMYPGRRGLGAVVWLVLAVGFQFLALDDMLQFHEQLGSWLKQPLGPAETFRNWNDVLVILYGLIAVVCGLLFLPEILRCPGLVPVFGMGFLFFAAHTAIDTLIEASGRKTMVEESAKLYATGFIALAMMTALRSVGRAGDGNGVQPPLAATPEEPMAVEKPAMADRVEPADPRLFSAIER